MHGAAGGLHVEAPESESEANTEEGRAETQRESFQRHCSDPGSGQIARLLSYENHFVFQ